MFETRRPPEQKNVKNTAFFNDFGPPWAVLGAFWADLGAPWGPPWGPLGGLLGPLGALQERFQDDVKKETPPEPKTFKNTAFFNDFGPPEGSLGGVLGPLGGLLGASWGLLRASKSDSKTMFKKRPPLEPKNVKTRDFLAILGLPGET